MMDENDRSQEMYALAKELFPLCRSITGDGVRQTLGILKRVMPSLTMTEVETGTKVFDWVIPKEWKIHGGYVEDDSGERVIDFHDNNLHIVGYSLPVDAYMTLEALRPHLYTIPEHPDWIPYVTSYYKERFGFCLSHRTLCGMKDGIYHAVIDSELIQGTLTYGEIVLPGKTNEEIFFSTYVCHPSLANNEVSGPVLAIHLARWIASLPDRRYTYRFAFVPETIGAIAYLHANLDTLKRKCVAGFNITCVGDDRSFSFLPSRYGNTYADRIARSVLSTVPGGYQAYSFLERGSDERQYCSPGVDLPVCSIMRSMYGTYPEYHTSADNLDLISSDGFRGSYDVYARCIRLLESNCRPRVTCLCEPQLGKRNLYPESTYNRANTSAVDILNVLAYSDGSNDIISLSEQTKLSVDEVITLVTLLKKAGLLSCTFPYGEN